MNLKSKAYYLTHVDETEAKELAEVIMAGIVSFEELQDTMCFTGSEQAKVRDLLVLKNAITNAIANATSVLELDDLLRRPNLSEEDRNKISQRILELRVIEEETIFNSAETLKELETFLNRFPSSSRVPQVRLRIEELKQKAQQQNEVIINDILSRVHRENPKFIRERYGEEVLKEVCYRIGLEYNDVINMREVVLNNSGQKPTDLSDIPIDNTDVFFWGLPSSGKSCALASIFNTISQEYIMEEPPTKPIFGGPYRISLSGVFNDNGIGYLPKGNAADLEDTHYMPFVLTERKTGKSINVAFLEIAGEIYKYFMHLAYPDANNTIPDEIKPTLDLLNIILKSPNPKIHFFFIDYQQETDTSNNIGSITRQKDYLKAAATYFNHNFDVFKYNTLAIHLVITKSDLIPVQGDRNEQVKRFAYDKFGGFIAEIKNIKKRNNIKNKTFIFPFSIGEVYFNKICKLNSDDAKIIINKLLEEIESNNSWWKKLQRKLNN